MPNMRKTKILCTLGPATESAEVITSLMEKGADIFRLNMSHASHDWVRTVYGRIREAASKGSKEISVLMDLTGPSIRTGDVETPWQLQVGDWVEFRCKPEVAATVPLVREHGIGVTKAKYLPIEQSSDLIELQRDLKRVFDPKELLNPGKIFPVGGHKSC